MSVVINFLQQTLESDPANWACREALVAALMGDEQSDAAYQVVNEGSEVFPEEPAGLIVAARTYALLDPASAIEVIDGVIAQDPTNAEACLEKCRFCLQLEDTETAARFYQAATRLNPELADEELSKALGSHLNAEPSPQVAAEPEAEPELTAAVAVAPEPEPQPEPEPEPQPAQTQSAIAGLKVPGLAAPAATPAPVTIAPAAPLAAPSIANLTPPPVAAPAVTPAPVMAAAVVPVVAEPEEEVPVVPLAVIPDEEEDIPVAAVVPQQLSPPPGA